MNTYPNGIPPLHAGETILRVRFCAAHYLKHISDGGDLSRWASVPERSFDPCCVEGCREPAAHREKVSFNGPPIRNVGKRSEKEERTSKPKVLKSHRTLSWNHKGELYHVTLSCEWLPETRTWQRAPFATNIEGGPGITKELYIAAEEDGLLIEDFITLLIQEDALPSYEDALQPPL